MQQNMHWASHLFCYNERIMELKIARNLFHVCCLSLLVLTTNVVAQDRTIIPGSRVGQVELGMSRKEVHRKLGKPEKKYGKSKGLASESWRLNINLEPLD